MKLHLHRTRPPAPAALPALEGEEYEALKNQREYDEEHGSVSEIVKKMGRENLDAPLRRD